MKKILSLMILSLMLVSLIGLASARITEYYDDPAINTIITGKVYDFSTNASVEGATVEVTCNGYLISNVTNSRGTYSVLYTDENICHEGSKLSVYAYKTGVGENTVPGTVHDNYPVINVNLGVVNVPLVPEFGAIVGVLTVLGAVSVFFVVRKK